METKNEDRRIQRTKRQVELALIRLLQKKSIHKISIRELAEEAAILFIIIICFAGDRNLDRTNPPITNTIDSILFLVVLQ